MKRQELFAFITDRNLFYLILVAALSLLATGFILYAGGWSEWQAVVIVFIVRALTLVAAFLVGRLTVRTTFGG